MRHALPLVISVLLVFAVIPYCPGAFAETARELTAKKIKVKKICKRIKHKKICRYPRCYNKKDDDRDGYKDFPADPGCKSRKDDSESNPGSAPPSPPDPNGPELGVNARTNGKLVFPASNPWNQDISNSPVDSNSNNLIASIGLNTGLHPDFGTVWNGAPNGIPYVIVPSSQPRSSVIFEYEDESDAGPYPIPLNPPIEGGPDGNGDRHVLMIDRDNWVLYELYHVFFNNNRWEAGSGAIFDLKSNALRPAGWTSADAAGLPIFPGLVRYEEAVERGEIPHALRFTVSRSRRAYVHPARHWASSNTDPNLPPMGMRVRLKASFDESSYPASVQVILRALKRYGMFVADNGSNWYVSGAPDPRWSDDELHTLGNVHGSDFEVIEMGEIITP
ncbi:hypothetical protein JNK13_07220 [bacterium]|nr:hypothetical protein [bacterium]